MSVHDRAEGLRLRALCVGYPARRGRPERRVLAGLDATAAPGELTVLIGPNGTGKSTLLRTMAAIQPPLTGRVLVDGIPVDSIPPAELARLMAVVLTERDLPPLLNARELAGLGRHPHTGFIGRLSARDHEIVAWALASVRASHLAGRALTELSDGERQRVLVARALAQQPSAILLDEPTAFLDVTSRVALMGLLRRLARERDLAIVVSTHDLELALRVADHIWLLDPDGRLHTGTPEELTLRGVVGASFDGEDLSFDPAAGVFALHVTTAGRMRVTADGVQRLLVERALAREGWSTAGDQAVDMAVEHTEQGYEAAFDGGIVRFATLPELAAWSREPAAKLAAAPPGLRPAGREAIGHAVLDTSGVGGFFAIELVPVEPGWRPLTDLFTTPDVLKDKIAELAARFATADIRAVASLLFQHLAARLWSPSLGIAVTHDMVADLTPGLHWRAASGGPLPLRAGRLTGWQVADPARLAPELYRTVVTDVLEPLAATVQTIVRVSPRVLWGDSTSALANALRILVLRRPALSGKAAALGQELLEMGLLSDTGRMAEPVPGQLFFARRNCCLYYRLCGGGICGDCVRLRPDDLHEHWEEVIRESEGAP
ncbi:hypothetical protein Ssi03_72560 [Sphaerisporangium siamense]|uniref:Iron complex transport system ATP-binding protein n=1 Tax=Sphaerisporangium siamense TaxID=795645 RepID=A0A7W7G8C2_9ACTN|nr:ATP-binding cassette domain-containing protein [Sphaerisporangium siamense]MBB4699355.1 iron complex transport system ATP-binding protein [Sphaerisporangium siamense]GII89266.1 hypothetical protein Ssi03_72560 [Sphaerisporangium siamense]